MFGVRQQRVLAAEQAVDAPYRPQVESAYSPPWWWRRARDASTAVSHEVAVVQCEHLRVLCGDQLA